MIAVQRRKERALRLGWKITRQSRQDFFADMFIPMRIEFQNFTRPFQEADKPILAQFSCQEHAHGLKLPGERVKRQSENLKRYYA